jgi:hypothetical protein
MLMLWARQTGKSTTTAVLALHHAIYRPGSLILVLSRSLRQSNELFRKIVEFLDSLPSPPRVRSRTALMLQLENGSRIISLPGSEETIRGYSGAALLIIDEASLVPDELYATVRPMLATSNGRLILLSTPFGKRGFFYEAFANGGPDWQRFTVSADQCPRIPREFLEEERRTLTAQWYAQEYECVFVSSLSQVFDPEVVRAAFDERAYALPWE